jgi:transaldolase/glucose-6-phosphate isomerase
MADNPLVALNALGQSVWLDFLSRDIIQSGKLKGLITGDGLSGVTSNPTIFQKAISGSEVYNPVFEQLIESGMKDEKQLFLTIAIEDIKAAADLLHPTFSSTGGHDGFVSIEVSPDLAFDTEATVREAREIFETVDRRNVMIKVPATREGLPAIEELTAGGVNVNVTLLFSVERYKDVTEAFISGLERRASRGEPVEGIASVASFFISRVDSLVDKLLDAAADRAGALPLKGRAAVANAKMAYQEYKGIFFGERFRALEDKGAQKQRLLWGSTSAKNPDYRDIKYVEELVAENSVNTLPENTIDAFRDHGEPRLTIEDNLDAERRFFDELRAVGIEIEEVAARLEQEGVKSFSDSYFALLDEIARKKVEFHV